MKTVIQTVFLSLLLLTLIACGSSASTATPAATSVRPASTLAPVATLTATTLPQAATATEVPLDMHAPYDERAVANEAIANALTQAEHDGRLVLLDFGANWCPDCLVLTALFEDPTVKPFLVEHYHVVRIDVGKWDKNLDLSQKYGSPIDNGIPAVVVLAPNGNIVATTKDGALANARTATPGDILALLKTWVAQKS